MNKKVEFVQCETLTPLENMPLLRRYMLGLPRALTWPTLLTALFIRASREILAYGYGGVVTASIHKKWKTR